MIITKQKDKLCTAGPS